MASAAVPETSFGWAIGDYLSIEVADPDGDAKAAGTSSSLTEFMRDGLINISFAVRFARQNGVSRQTI